MAKRKHREVPPPGRGRVDVHLQDVDGPAGEVADGGGRGDLVAHLDAGEGRQRLPQRRQHRRVGLEVDAAAVHALQHLPLTGIARLAKPFITYTIFPT